MKHEPVTKNEILGQSLLTIQELAAHLNISPATINRYVKDRRIAHIRIGKAIRFCPKDIDAWKERRKIKAAGTYGI